LGSAFVGTKRSGIPFPQKQPLSAFLTARESKFRRAFPPEHIQAGDNPAVKFSLLFPFAAKADGVGVAVILFLIAKATPNGKTH
jgi:hypothetical protein